MWPRAFWDGLHLKRVQAADRPPKSQKTSSLGDLASRISSGTPTRRSPSTALGLLQAVLFCALRDGPTTESLRPGFRKWFLVLLSSSSPVSERLPAGRGPLSGLSWPSPLSPPHFLSFLVSSMHNLTDHNLIFIRLTFWKVSFLIMKMMAIILTIMCIPSALFQDFLGCPVIKTLCSQCRGHGFDPWLGN